MHVDDIEAYVLGLLIVGTMRRGYIMAGEIKDYVQRGFFKKHGIRTIESI